MSLICKKPYLRLPTKVKAGILLSPGGKQSMVPFGCGQCLPCRINKARIWAHRLMLEQRVWEKSCFVTLTYNPENLPPGDNLNPKDLTKFLKRLRRRYVLPIRYFACGEYGSLNERAHYHLVIFGMGLEDEEIIKEGWKNPVTKEQMGIVHVGELNKESARYITGYVTKGLKKGSPELKGKHPEFSRMSKGGKFCKGGIGYPAIEAIANDLMGKRYWKKRIIKEFKYGKKKMPVGRYLMQKLNNLQGITEEEIEEDLFKYALDYLEFTKDDNYYLNLKEDSAARIKAIEKRYKILRQRRRIK